MLNRRAFLQGSAGVTIGLPFLESIPERSAWSADSAPLFAFFIGTSNGVVQDRFWPSASGAELTDLSTDVNAAGALAGFEQWISFCQGFRYTQGPTGDTHADSYVQTFTGAPGEGGGNRTTSTAPSIDTILAPYLNPDGAEPLALYAGSKPGYIDERLSFSAAGQLRPAEGNPYQVYLDLVQAGAPSGESPDAALADRIVRRSTAIDFVRDDLSQLLGRSDLGTRDRQRLELHLDSLRELELRLEALPEGMQGCGTATLDLDAIAASAETYRDTQLREETAELQMQLAAFAFACNINHVATLQHGDGQDSALYKVPSNVDRLWNFHHISHRVQSDGAAGMDELAEAAHAEIDRLRLETFRRGLVKFEEYGLLERSVIMWANQFADGPSGSINNLPIVLAGNAGGALRTGLHLRPDEDSGFGGSARYNGQLLNTIAFALGVDEQIGVTEGLVDDLLV
jgi:hypothetical protein